MARTPVPSRPHMPGYGVEYAEAPPGEAFPWAEVDARLTDARCYWIVTADGARAHAVPVWGMWFGDRLVFDSGRGSRKTRNMQANPDIVVHLDGGENAIVLEGTVRPIDDRALLERFAAGYLTKYDWKFDPDKPPGIVFVFEPRVCICFREELGDTATRWRFA